jgi:hypothetical protein
MSKAEATLGNLRKDYILEKFVILPDTPEGKTHLDPLDKKCPYCPGNESMTGPALISLVSKDGMLQRLSDSEGSVIENRLQLLPSHRISIATSPCIVNLHMVIIKSWLLPPSTDRICQKYPLNNGKTSF